jgi:hypothetical protein
MTRSVGHEDDSMVGSTSGGCGRSLNFQKYYQYTKLASIEFLDCCRCRRIICHNGLD